MAITEVIAKLSKPILMGPSENYHGNSMNLSKMIRLATFCTAILVTSFPLMAQSTIPSDLQDSIYESFKNLDQEQLEQVVESEELEDLEFTASGEIPSIEELKAMQKHVKTLYKRLEPAVVNINNGRGQGTGVVVTKDGYILTAAHVIGQPNILATVTFPDGTRAKAQTLGMDVGVDAGLLRIIRMDKPRKRPSRNKSDDEEKKDDKDSDDDKSDKDDDEESDEDKSDDDSDDDDSDDDEDQKKEDSDDDDSDDADDDDKDKAESDNDKKSKSKDDKKAEGEEARLKRPSDRFKVDPNLPEFPYLDIGDSSELSNGQWLIAIGHPGGINMKRGLVLRVARINNLNDRTITTDCALVGGDSGGPLIDMHGRVIGIHSRIGGRLRQNFHVPSNQFSDQWTELSEPVILDVPIQLGLSLKDRSNVIERVRPGSPSARAGLRVMDRITRMDDQEVYDLWQFKDAIADFKPFQEVEVEIQRKGKKRKVMLVVGRNPNSRVRPGR